MPSSREIRNHDELREIGHEIDGLLTKPVSARHFHAELSRCLGIVVNKPKTDRRKPNALQWSRFRGLDILLVEDVEINQEVITELLSAVGLPVRLAQNGAEALEVIAAQKPDLILMDCHMPVMDGYTATRMLRDNPETRSIPIIALTANAMAADREKCLAAGMNAHVAKPIRMERLYAQMVRCLPTNAAPPIPTLRASAERAVTKAATIPELPGIDQAAGLTFVGGQPAVFLSVLKQFRDTDGKHFLPRYQALKENDWDARVRLVHSLKGVALTLGMNDLAETTTALQAAAKAKDADVCARLFPDLEERLQRVLEGLAHLDDQVIAAHQTGPNRA